MFPKIKPTSTPAWKALEQHRNEMKQIRMKDMFAQDPERFKKYSFRLNDIAIDFSKNIINERTMKLLLQMAHESKVREAIEAMFEGEIINETEHRSVLHIALRNFSGKPLYSEGKNVMEDVIRVQNQMKAFCGKVHSGEWKGYNGK